MPSRRAMLALLATTATTATAGCASVPNGPLPGSVVRERTQRLSTPTVPDAVNVTDDHVAGYRTRLERAIDDANEAWDAMDSAPEHPLLYSDVDIEQAQEFLDGLADEPRTLRTLESAQYHVHMASAAGGYARAVAGDLTADDVRTEAERLAGEADAFRESFEYAAVDPRRFLAYGNRIEYSVRQAALGADDGPDDDEYLTATDLGGRMGVLARVETDLLDARELRESYQNHEGTRTGFGAELSRIRRRTRGALEPRIEELQAFESTLAEAPARSWHDAMFREVRYASNTFRDARGRADDGYELRAVGLLVEATARVHGVEDFRTLVGEPDASFTPEMSEVFRAKREARDRLREALAADPDPLTAQVLGHAGKSVTSGDITLRFLARGDENPAGSRAEALFHYRTAAVTAERAAAITERVVERA